VCRRRHLRRSNRNRPPGPVDRSFFCNADAAADPVAGVSAPPNTIRRRICVIHRLFTGARKLWILPGRPSETPGIDWPSAGTILVRFPQVPC
jgi:hypothetical protein